MASTSTPPDAAVESAAKRRDRLERLAGALMLAALAAETGEGDEEDVNVAASALETAAWTTAIILLARQLRSRRAANSLERRLRREQTKADLADLVKFARDAARESVREAQAQHPGDEITPEPAAVRERAEARLSAIARTTATRVAAERVIELSDHVATTLGRGGELNKVWITRGDSKVRDLHRRLHGRTRAPDTPFYRWLATGQALRFPGDPEAPLDATINCRCALWFTWKDEAAATEAALRPIDLEESFAASGGQ